MNPSVGKIKYFFTNVMKLTVNSDVSRFSKDMQGKICVSSSRTEKSLGYFLHYLHVPGALMVSNRTYLYANLYMLYPY